MKEPLPDDAARHTLLITDDCESVLHTLAYVLSRHGYRMLLAQSGKAALEIAGRETVDAA